MVAPGGFLGEPGREGATVLWAPARSPGAQALFLLFGCGGWGIQQAVAAVEHVVAEV
jgi:hypothetical protein